MTDELLILFTAWAEKVLGKTIIQKEVTKSPLTGWFYKLLSITWFGNLHKAER
ncbi:hypothetical protein HRbin01_00716 [archaeon HR01]|nr:hypothetical protein HRbin01_00716 [archaeon HR01]